MASLNILLLLVFALSKVVLSAVHHDQASATCLCCHIAANENWIRAHASATLEIFQHECLTIFLYACIHFL